MFNWCVEQNVVCEHISFERKRTVSNKNGLLLLLLLLLLRVQELSESRGGRLRLSVLTSLLVSVDVKLY